MSGVLHDASDSDAWGKLEELAKGVVEKAAGDLSEAQAMAKILKTAEGAKLYTAYLGDYAQGL
jgi:hypothetical protein